MREENAVSSKAVNQMRAEEVTRGKCMNAASAMWQLQLQMQTDIRCVSTASGKC